MNNTPLVSVGLPTYNRASDLRQAVESVLAQEYPNLELVISDNGSTDHTQCLCEEFCARDSRVKYIRQSTNRGPRANFLEVLRQARGEFFMCLGDDDWLDHDYIARCVEVLIAHPDHSLVCGTARYFQNGDFLLEGETINLLQSSGAERVLAYYKQVWANGTFYGLMRRRQLCLTLPQNVLGADWLMIASIAFMGKIETVKDTTVNRSWEGSSRSLKTLTEILGISGVHARVPQLSIAVSAFKDIAWKSKVYASLGRVARLLLARKVFSVFYQRYLKGDLRAFLYPFWARPVSFAISVRDRIRKRYLITDTRALYRTLVPLPVRLQLRRACDYGNQKYLRFRLFGRYASLIPPLELMHDGPIGYEEFKENGVEFFRYYTEVCGLKPDEQMLDVGSGMGRKTFLLTSYLRGNGSYDGLDIVKSGIDWCTTRITRKHPRFRFHLIDVYNQHYNPTGRYKGAEFRFPFADESFDFVVLASVFTHMLPQDMENYLSEVARVLRKGGRCLISFFLLNPKSIDLMDSGKSSLSLAIRIGPCRVANAEVPEGAIGCEEDFVESIYERNNLEIIQPIRYGSWCGRENFLSYQDLILALKPASDAGST